MKAILVERFGGPEVLRLSEVDEPVPGEGQVVVKLEAAGVNFIDIYQRSGQYAVDLPFVPGNEGAGIVVAVGPGVTEVAKGDRVAYTGARGAYAAYAAVPARSLVKLPAGIDVKVAAALMLQGMTAHYLAHSTYPLGPEDGCLVHAGAGGVGLLLTQMAKARGARVISTVSTPEKAALSKEAGADEVIFYTDKDFEAEVKRLTGGEGVQVVYDSVGKTTFDKGLNCLAPRGMMVLYGQSSGAVLPLDPQLLNAKGSLFLTRPSLVHYLHTRDELLWRAGEVLGWAASGTLKVRIDSELGLEEAAEAQRRLENRETSGKVLLTL